MPDQKISADPAATDLVGAVIPIVQSGANKKANSTMFLLTGENSNITAPIVIAGSSANTLKFTFDNLGVTQTNGAGHWLANNQPALLNSQQISPSTLWEGQGNGSTVGNASQSVKFIADVLPVQAATNPTGTWRLRSSINGGAYADRLVVESGGNVGIGTSSPSELLHVSKSVNTGSVMLFDNPNAGTSAFAGVTLRVNGNTSGYIYYTSNTYAPTSTLDNSLVLQNAGGGRIVLYNGSATTMVTSSANNVTIGTGNVSEFGKLFVSQSALSTTHIPAFRVDAGAHTALTTLTEFPDVVFTGSVHTWAAGTIPTQRFNWLKTSSVVTGLATNAYTLYAEAPTGNITNAWAAGFAGNVFIGTGTPTTGSILLELSSTTRAMLITRMTQAQRNAIGTALAGMVVYQTDATPGLRVYNGTNWMRFTETID